MCLMVNSDLNIIQKTMDAEDFVGELDNRPFSRPVTVVNNKNESWLHSI